MKFTIKTLVAAVAFAAAGHAMAAIQPGDTARGALGGELVFYAWDDVTKTSYVKDLGVGYSAFLSSPSFASVSIAADTNWLSYLTSVSNDTANTKWGVFGTMKTSATAAGGVNILTTARLNTPVATGSSLVRGIDGQFNTTFLGGLESTNGDYSQNLSYFRTGATNPGNWAAPLQHNLGGKVSFNTDNAIGFSADFYKLTVVSGTANATRTTLLDAPTQWKFDSAYNLQVTPVPEPESYAMMLAGLVMLGSIARRRIGKN